MCHFKFLPCWRQTWIEMFLPQNRPISLFFFNEQEMTWQLGELHKDAAWFTKARASMHVVVFLFYFLSSLPPSLLPFLAVHAVSNYGPVSQKAGIATNGTWTLNWISLTDCSPLSPLWLGEAEQWKGMWRVWRHHLPLGNCCFTFVEEGYISDKLIKNLKYISISLWSSGQSSWLHNGDVLCFLWGTNCIYICYVEESRSPLWSSGQSSWLQIKRSWFDSRRYQIFREVVGLEQGPLSLVSTTEGLLGSKKK
jgi:hypothetical protein